MMKFNKAAALLSIPLLFAGCQNEAEETPDITEAIPLDDPTGGASAEEAIGDGEPDIEPSAPPTMESGSNEEGGRQPDPSRSKLLPAE